LLCAASELLPRTQGKWVATAATFDGAIPNCARPQCALSTRQSTTKHVPLHTTQPMANGQPIHTNTHQRTLTGSCVLRLLALLFFGLGLCFFDTSLCFFDTGLGLCFFGLGLCFFGLGLCFFGLGLCFFDTYRIGCCATVRLERNTATQSGDGSDGEAYPKLCKAGSDRGHGGGRSSGRCNIHR
jgi:hypothetical protein